MRRLAGSCLTLAVSAAAAFGSVGLPSDPRPSSLLARDEFTNYVCRITGRTDACPPTVIGTVETLGDRVPAAAKAALAKTGNIEASWTGFDGKTLWFVGKEEVAELYAVYHFLESKLGVRWFQAKTAEDPGDWVPRMERIGLKPFAEFREPKFRIRRPDQCHSYGNVIPTNALTCAVRNGFQAAIPYGGRLDYGKRSGERWDFYAPRIPHRLIDLGGDHVTFVNTFPAKTEFGRHPEVFALVDGKRVKGQQYCISNPLLRQATAERIIGMLDRTGGDGQFVFGMQDVTYGWCECGACTALDGDGEKAVGAPDVTRRFMLTVKDICARVWAKYPKADLRMWAYHTYRRLAKDIRMDPRLKVCFCDHGRCYGHKLDDPHCARNVRILGMMKDWLAVTPEVYVYGYLFCTEAYYSCNEWGVADDIRRYRDLGLIGWKEEASFSDAKFVKLEAGGGYRPDSFPSVWQTLYVIGHMLWDPDLDEKALVAEAESKYYGAAYPAMKKYHDFRRKLWENNPHCMGYPNGDERRPTLLDMPGAKERLLSLLDQADRLLRGAEDVAPYRMRVARDRRWLQRYWIEENERLRAKRGAPTFCAARTDEPVVADGRVSEGAWARARYCEFGGVTVGAAYDAKSISFYSTGRDETPVFCLYPPNIDNRRYRFTVAPDGKVSCEMSAGGGKVEKWSGGKVGATAAVRKTALGTACEITIPTEGIFRPRTGDSWQVMFGNGPAGADWEAGTGYSAMTLGLPYPVNGNFAKLDAKGQPAGWLFGDAGGELVKEDGVNRVALRGKMSYTMASGEMAQCGEARKIRFSFRAKGEGRIRVAFHRYTDTADADNADRFRKHTYKRQMHQPHGQGGAFKLSPAMQTFSGEYTVAPNEWCAIAFYHDGSSEPAIVSDVSVTRIEE